MGDEMTPKQAAFVDEYLIDLNATQAAIRAGYSAKTAEWIGPQLLGKLTFQLRLRSEWKTDQNAPR
ncbi:MAG: terminase small subunit [Candidatus Accumulibacter sp.]|nr:terminase small subunit [Accumulibacter sp.]